MKATIITTALFISFFSLFAQPKSPRLEAKGSINNVPVLVDYGAPSVKERVIWGDLVPYDKVWRTGANEATTVEIGEDVMVNGNLLPAGKYALFTIPSKDQWTIIFNSDYNQWGAYKYDEAKNVLKVKVPVEIAEHQEQMLISVEDSSLKIHWEKVMVSVGFTAKG